MKHSNQKYPSKDHARKVAARLRVTGRGNNGVIYLEGQKTIMMEDNDEVIPFRQRRNFFYLCGCALPDCYLTYEIENDRLTLYIPPIDPDSVIWSGLPLFPKEAMELYDVDSVLLNTEIVTYLNHYCDTCENPSRLFAIDGRTSPDVALLPFDEIDFNYLKRAIENCRVTKDSHEIALMQRANDVSSQAHIGVWKSVNSTSNEMHLEATHISACLSSGCKTQAYHPIVASGTNSATLHYTKNNQDLTGRLNVLVDAAGEYNTYCADITRTFPISGKFSPETRSVYDIVMKMQLVSISMIHSGASWEAIHANAHRIAINGLLTLGILKGKESEIFDKGVSVAFFPHGLGHYIGMDTHDVGGHPNYSDPNPMFRYLRVRGKLPVNSVITVEPGIYFCRFIIEPFISSPDLSKYIDTDILDKYWSVGGVRIEDSVQVTETGCVNLTSAPKIPEEVEKIVSGNK